MNKLHWVSVAEGLPNAGKEVYVTDGEYVARANLLDDVFPGDQPCWSYSGIGEITHWCENIPLPHFHADGTMQSTDGETTTVTIPVQPHGRLIDVDALWREINKICDRRDAGIISDLTCLQQLLSAVRHAPTIIPAEEGKT